MLLVLSTPIARDNGTTAVLLVELATLSVLTIRAATTMQQMTIVNSDDEWRVECIAH